LVGLSNISDVVFKAGCAILSVPPEDALAKLKEQLRRLISSDFAIDSGAVFDASGKSTPTYPIVIYRADTERVSEVDGQLTIPADCAAVVIDVCDEINVERLHQAYTLVSQVKQVAKTPVPKTEGNSRTNITLGVVFALRSTVSLDILADELYRLNLSAPFKHWLDMLVVAPNGVVNYALQFPGEASLAGDFLPPAEGALDTIAPSAFYVTIVMRPTRQRSFNKLIAFVLAHLQLFSPDATAKQLNWNLILEGLPTGAVTTFGFQPNQQGQLVAVPSDGYTGKFIPNKPVLIESEGGEILAAITFLKWQTGGVIILAGKLPLEGMLLFLPDPRPEYRIAPARAALRGAMEDEDIGV
jgi:hypothetical protein